MIQAIKKTAEQSVMFKSALCEILCSPPINSTFFNGSNFIFIFILLDQFDISRRGIVDAGIVSLFNTTDLLNLDLLLAFDLKLWKEIRLNIREMYIASLLNIAEYKLTLGIRFAKCT